MYGSPFQVGLVGHGFVGKALRQSFEKRGAFVFVYDKFQNLGCIDDVMHCEMVFFCLPTPFVEGYGYDLSPIVENLKALKEGGFSGVVILKSTVEIGVSEKLQRQFGIPIIHNPEFLSSKTAFEDFDKQTHIVIGETKRQLPDQYVIGSGNLVKLYSQLYPDAEISVCDSKESEAMKIMANSFYAQKIQIMNSYFFLCQRTSTDFERVRELMIKNGWINPMHTQVPGTDGQFSYGNVCFPKDTNALLHQMKTLGTPHKVLEAVIKERDSMRPHKLK